jgi:hypothetical protein
MSEPLPASSLVSWWDRHVDAPDAPDTPGAAQGAPHEARPTLVIPRLSVA